MNCPVCQAPLAGKVKFCPECGANLSQSSVFGVDVAAPSAPSTVGGGDTSLGDLRTEGASSGTPADEVVVRHAPLAERYVLEATLGSGGFATVYRAHDRNLRRDVAIKRLRPAPQEDVAASVQRFAREAEAIAKLSHRNIVIVYEQAQDADGRYIVMELITGGTLRDHYRQTGKLAVDEAVRIIKGICKGLSYAHRRNLVHRDIKPGNVLLAEEDGELIPKIVDFGLARLTVSEDVSLSRSGFGMGTPAYMPPEQRQNAKSVNHTADIYAVGKTLYELVTGESPEHVDPELLAGQADLSKIIFRCIKTRPEDRYFSIDELLNDLDKLAAAPVVRPAPPTTQASQEDLIRRNACAKCGSTNNAGDRYCLSCGSELHRKCPECDREGSQLIRYCGGCGTEIDGFVPFRETLERVHALRDARQWDRIAAEAAKAPQSARLPGPRGTQMKQQLVAAVELAGRNAEELRQLLQEEATVPDDTRMLAVLRRLQELTPPDVRLSGRIQRLDQRLQFEALLRAETEAAEAKKAEEERNRKERAAKLFADGQKFAKSKLWADAVAALSQIESAFVTSECRTLLQEARQRQAKENQILQERRTRARQEQQAIEALGKNPTGAARTEAIRRTESLRNFTQEAWDDDEPGEPDEIHLHLSPYDDELMDVQLWAEDHLEQLNSQPVTDPAIDNDFQQARRALALQGNSRYYTERVWPARLPVWKAAAQHDPKALWLVADCLLEGIGGPRDNKAAFDMFLKAAGDGLAQAQVTVGRMYASGVHVAENPTLAVMWWQRAADQGDLEGLSEIARCHLRGFGLPKDPARGFNLLQQHAGRKDPGILSHLAYCHLNGRGTAKDPAAAYRVFSQAAELGKVDSMWQCGLALLQGRGVAANKAQAVQWLQKAAKEGNLPAMTKLEELGVPSGRVCLKNSAGMVLVRVPEGQFRMGSPVWKDPAHASYRDENPEHVVQILRPFLLAQCPVTQEQYQQVTGKNPSKFKGLIRKTPTHPVEMVSWLEAVAFCNQLSKQEGLTPFYRISGPMVQIQEGPGYRLPTEAEWEYACRARTSGLWYWGNDEDDADTYAWVRRSSDDRGTHPVGEKKSNHFGLKDMLGNVWEWCWDWYDETYYTRSPPTSPTGPAQGTTRVVRGGSWDNVAMNARCALRAENGPDERHDDIGFRVARYA